MGLARKRERAGVKGVRQAQKKRTQANRLKNARLARLTRQGRLPLKGARRGVKRVAVATVLSLAACSGKAKEAPPAPPKPGPRLGLKGKLLDARDWISETAWPATKKFVTETSKPAREWVAEEGWPWAKETAWPAVETAAGDAYSFSKKQVDLAWKETRPLRVKGVEELKKVPGYVRDGFLYVYEPASNEYRRVSPKARELLSEAYRGGIRPAAVCVGREGKKVFYYVYDHAKGVWHGYESS